MLRGILRRDVGHSTLGMDHLSTKFRLRIQKAESAWDGFVGAGDADPVIGEVGMHTGEFDFGHVTGHTLFGAHRAGVGVAASGFCVSWFG